MSVERTQDLIEKIYEDNYSHIDFMDNMGGDCKCDIHLELIKLAKSIGITNEEWEENK